jgi:hypothetical protein
MAHFIRTLVEALKEAFSQAEVKAINKTLVASALGKLAWVFPLILYPGMFSVSPYYTAMRHNAPEWVWASAFFLLFLYDIFSIAVVAFKYQIVALGFSAFTWGALSVLIGVSSPHTVTIIPAAPGAIIYFVGSIWSALGMVHRCIKYRQDCERYDLLRIRDMAARAGGRDAFLRTATESRIGRAATEARR